jgi:hypothetical protein
MEENLDLWMILGFINFLNKDYIFLFVCCKDGVRNNLLNVLKNLSINTASHSREL